MAIHLYLDEQLTQQISEGDFSNPDADNYNGTDGEIKDRQIFVANEQTTLAAPIDDIQTDIELTEPRFADAPVYSGYDYTGLVVDPIDEFETDESVWYKLALTQAELDTATQSAPLNLGAKAHNQTISFWRRCTVLSGTPVQKKSISSCASPEQRTPFLRSEPWLIKVFREPPAADWTC